jgi:SAM-dependent methyltransferase
MRLATATETRVVACEVCGREAPRVLAGYEKDYLVRCAGCGFVYSSRLPTQSELDAVYDRYTRQDQERTPATIAKLERTVERLLAIAPGRRVLDVGCNEGTLLEIFAAQGCEVHGTEYDARAAATCRAKGITVVEGRLLPDQAPAGGFDVVVLTEVIEHVNDARALVSGIHSLLAPGGVLYVTTPNFASLERRLIGPGWGMLTYPEHVTYWTPGTLDRLLTSCGLERMWLRSESISVYRIVQYLNARRGPGGASRDPEQVSARAQRAVAGNRVLGWARHAVNAVLAATGTGSSLVALYRRPIAGASA